MAVNIKAKLAEYHAALNAFDMEKVASLFAENAEYCSPGIKGCLSGKATIMKAFRAYFAEYSDQSAVNESYELIGPLQLRTHWHLTATSKTSGRTVKRHGTERTTFNKAGQIVLVEVEDVEPEV